MSVPHAFLLNITRSVVLMFLTFVTGETQITEVYPSRSANIGVFICVKCSGVHDFTRYIWVFFLVDKSDVFATFKSFVKDIHNEFETTIKKVRSDNRSEFKNTRVDDL